MTTYLDQLEPGQSAYELGKDLFGADGTPPATLSATYKRKPKAELRAKHRL